MEARCAVSASATANMREIRNNAEQKKEAEKMKL